MRRSRTLCALLALYVGLSLCVWADTIPPRGTVDSRVRTLAYNAEDVIKLTGFVGYQIHFQFAPDEEFVNLGAGDNGGIDVGWEKNHLFLKPKAGAVSTNLTLLTNKRAYQIDYRVLNKHPDPRVEEVVYSVRFTYPQDVARRNVADEEGRKAEARLAVGRDESGRNWNYWGCGSGAIRPIQVFDDGVLTHLKFGARSDIPAMFIQNEDGGESLLNFTVDRDEVLIHRVAHDIVLRRGRLVACIQNRSFDGGGERLSSGTVVPDVQRETKAVRP